MYKFINLLPFNWLVKLADLYLINIGRLEILNNAFSYVKASNIKGDYLEFGVWGGNTFAMAYHCAKNRGLDGIRFYAFDSFQGLPKEAEEYELSSNPLWEGRFEYSKERFKKNIKKKGVDLKKVIVVKGWFEEVLKTELKRKMKKASVVMIDCDLYKSAISVLEFITDLLVNGSVLIFDDWFLFEGSPDKGVQKACNEWLIKHTEIELIEYRKFGWHGNSFLVRLRD